MQNIQTISPVIFPMQKGILAVITVSGLIYNLGLMARPWFEGQMIQCLFFIQKGQSHFSDMLKLALLILLPFLRFRSPVSQTSVCAPLRQQYQPQYETDVL